MTALSPWRAGLVPCAGLIAGPLAWAVNVQLGLILPYSECGVWLKPELLISLLATLCSLAAAIVSWRARDGNLGAPRHASGFPLSYRFVAVLSALSGFLFAYALALQAAAALVLTGCER